MAVQELGFRAFCIPVPAIHLAMYLALKGSNCLLLLARLSVPIRDVLPV